MIADFHALESFILYQITLKLFPRVSAVKVDNFRMFTRTMVLNNGSINADTAKGSKCLMLTTRHHRLDIRMTSL
jgi:hypothetical protein